MALIKLLKANPQISLAEVQQSIPKANKNHFSHHRKKVLAEEA